LELVILPGEIVEGKRVHLDASGDFLALYGTLKGEHRHIRLLN
jgi:hypothetical protein